MEHRPFFNRNLISLVTALSFVAMSLSGIAAFIVPQGKVAYWTNWSFLGLSKTEWGNIHITTSVLFLIAGVWHTWYNWIPLMQYLKGIPGRVAASRRDLSVAILVTVFFAAGAVFRTPPLDQILIFNNWIKESWVRTPADDPPFGHAELLSLKGFCRKMYIDTPQAMAELRRAGLTVADENGTLEQIARKNGVTPAAVYQHIKKLEHPENSPLLAAAPVTVPVSRDTVREGRTAARVPATVAAAADIPRYTGDLVVERFEGKGIGKKRLDAICAELKLDCGAIRRKLAAKNVTVLDDETFKEAATRQGIVPIELLKIILDGEPI